jgi:hypothetical protein
VVMPPMADAASSSSSKLDSCSEARQMRFIHDRTSALMASAHLTVGKAYTLALRCSGVWS